MAKQKRTKYTMVREGGILGFYHIIEKDPKSYGPSILVSQLSYDTAELLTKALNSRAKKQAKKRAKLDEKEATNG